ncbi:iron complex transport system substrate-binding protein [Rhodococcus sp. 27YEA15]|uniref:ABC transporter substrate-binding protein n=1 Tax=Rhodococcus sp. 27YEA15 TaxID=3156259 RepID=UPI003C7AEBB8
MTLIVDTSVPQAHWDELVASITRRQFFSGVAGVATAVALTACGTSDGSSASGNERLPYTWGEFSADVPRDPKRVVVLDGRVDLEFAMMMDYPVVGSGNSWFPDAKIGAQFPGRTIESATAVNNIGDYTINFENLLVLDPDLIVMTEVGYLSDWYGNDRLATIAPLLVVGDDKQSTPSSAVDWRGALLEQANQLDRKSAAEAMISEYETKLNGLRPTLAAALGGKNVVFGVLSDSGFLVHQRSLPLSVCLDAGLTVPFRDDTNADNGFELGFEQLDQLASADVIIAQAGRPEVVGIVGAQPTWQRLPAVQAGNVVTVDARYNQGFALTASIFLDVLVEAAEKFTAA